MHRATFSVPALSDFYTLPLFCAPTSSPVRCPFGSHRLPCFLDLLTLFYVPLQSDENPAGLLLLDSGKQSQLLLVGGRGTGCGRSYINMFFLPHLILSTEKESREARTGGYCRATGGQSPGGCGLLPANGISVVKQQVSTEAKPKSSQMGLKKQQNLAGVSFKWMHFTNIGFLAHSRNN